MTNHSITDHSNASSSCLLRRSILGVTALALLSAAACDLEPEDGLDDGSREAECGIADHDEEARLELELADEEDLAMPMEDLQPDSSTLAAAQGDPLLATYANTYDGVRKLSDLADGDVIMIKNFANGYLGCNDAGDVFSAHAPMSNDNYLWVVHRVDLDIDGTDELQLERFHDPGEFLKLTGGDELYCGVVTGYGTAATWRIAGALADASSVYKRVGSTLSNYMTSACLKSSSSSGGSGASCGTTTAFVFFFEILDHA